MTSPITAVVSNAAAQVPQSNPNAARAGDAAQGHVSANHNLRANVAAAERLHASDEKRTIKRQETRAEGAFAGQKHSSQGTPQQAAVDAENEPLEDAPRGHLDVAV